MKKFNRTITVSVSLDAIANKVLSTLDKTNPNRELIAETIVGCIANSGEYHIALLYNSLAGWNEEINIEEGKQYSCNVKALDFYPRRKPNEYEGIIVKVSRIDKYRASHQVYVTCSYTGLNGKLLAHEQCVNFSDLAELSESDLIFIDDIMTAREQIEVKKDQPIVNQEATES